MNLPISNVDIELTHQRISPYIYKTAVLTSHSINKMVGAELFFKTENLQKVGAFKARGAMNAVLNLREAEKKKGVATHSSGNHGQALAWAAAQKNMPAFVVMPSNSPQVKIDAVRGYGADVILCAPTLKAREETLAKVVQKTGATFVHPYNNLQVISGQATCAKELLQQVINLDAIIAPVGGGGLLSGTALSAHYFGKNVRVFAGEPEMADDAKQSFAAGKIIPSVNPNTLADGLKTSLGDKTFPIIKTLVSDIFTVTEAEILVAMRLVWERMKLIIEPSAAVCLAAILKQKKAFAGQRIGVILTGGNVDLNTFFQALK